MSAIQYRFKKWLPALFSVLCLGIVCFQVLSPVFDSFWHVRLAKDWIENGLSPFTDNYSFTFTGEKVAFVPYGAEIVMYGFTLLGNDVFGLQFFMFFSFFVASMVLLDILQTKSVPLHLQILGMVMFAAIFLDRREPRPESLCMILFILQVRLLICSDQLNSLRVIWQYVLFQFIWSNMHSSSLLGYAIGFSIFVQIGYQNFVARSGKKFWISWLAAGVASIVVGFLNLNFSSVLTTMLSEQKDWSLLINEWFPLTVKDLIRPTGWLIPLAPLLIVGTAIRRKFGEAILLLIFFLYSIKYWRIVPLYSSIALPILLIQTSLLANHFEQQIKRRSRLALRGLVNIFFVCLFIFFFERVFFSGSHFAPEFAESHHPVDVFNYMEKEGLKGKVRNQLENGGYLLYKLGPTQSIFIDGRVNLLYSYEFTEKAFAAQDNIDSFNEELNRYSYDYVIPDIQYPSRLFETALMSGLFHLQFVGEAYALLDRNSSQFPLGTVLLMKPHCIQPAQLSALESELRLSQDILPIRSPLRKSLEVAVLHLGGEAIKQFENIEVTDFYQPHYARTLGEFALKAGNKEVARIYLGQINRFRNRDKILLARLDCELNECKRAEELIEFFASELSDAERVAVLQILDRILQVRSLKASSMDQANRIRQNLRAQYMSKGVPIPSLDSDCRDPR